MTDFHEEEEQYFCRFTFGQFVSLALLELIALFFVFYLGARYGPELLGNRERDLGEGSFLEAPTEALPTGTGGEAAAVDYTYPEALTREPAETVSPPPIVPTRPPIPVPPPTPSAPTAAPVMGRYSIQVGSYQQAAGASQKIGQWQSKGYDAFMSIGEIPNQGTWYRVRIGNFSTREQAKTFLEQLTRQENIPAIIVRNNS